MQLETMYSTVDEARVATLMLNRPHVLNCANEQWARDLNTLVDDLATRREAARRRRSRRRPGVLQRRRCHRAVER